MASQDKKEESFDYDAILEYTGQMGKFQLRNCILLFFPVIFPGMAVMSYTFTAAMPQYRYDWDYLPRYKILWDSPSGSRVYRCNQITGMELKKNETKEPERWWVCT